MAARGHLRRRWSVLLLVIVLIASAALAETASADSGSSTVTVTATNNAKLTISIADASAAFGTTLDPTGAGTGGEISAVAGSTGSQGVYYVWTPATSPLVTVKSNMTWNGTVAASENAGTSASLTVASGALRFGTSAPATYAAASALTAFATSAAAWQSNVAKGANTYANYFALRVDWTDDPGTFSSTVTYSAAQ